MQNVKYKNGHILTKEVEIMDRCGDNTMTSSQIQNIQHNEKNKKNVKESTRKNKIRDN